MPIKLTLNRKALICLENDKFTHKVHSFLDEFFKIVIIFYNTSAEVKKKSADVSQF